MRVIQAILKTLMDSLSFAAWILLWSVILPLYVMQLIVTTISAILWILIKLLGLLQRKLGNLFLTGLKSTNRPSGL